MRLICLTFQDGDIAALACDFNVLKIGKFLSCVYVRENPDFEIEFCPASRNSTVHSLVHVYNAADNRGTPEDSLRFQWSDRMAHIFRNLLL